jgi:hypothetical protein
VTASSLVPGASSFDIECFDRPGDNMERVGAADGVGGTPSHHKEASLCAAWDMRRWLKLEEVCERSGHSGLRVNDKPYRRILSYERSDGTTTEEPRPGIG